MTTRDVVGADLREDHVLVEHMPDGCDVLHLIHHFTEYLGRFLGAGDHARRAHDATGLWCCTVADLEKFHVQVGSDQ